MINLCAVFAAIILLQHACGEFVLADQAKQTSAPVIVKAVKIGEEGDTRAISGMGSICCPHHLELGFDDTGVVGEIPVEEGDMVQKDQVLAKLESSVVSAEKAAQEARLLSALAEVKYYQNEVVKKENLYTKQAISSTELEKAVLELDKSKAMAEYVKAEINTLETKLNKRILRAPLSGLVTERHVSVGSVIMPSSNKVLTLIECSTAYAEIELGEKTYALLQPGMHVKILVDALGGQTFYGEVLRVSPRVDKKNRTFTLKVSIKNHDWLLKPGMFARGEIAVPSAVKVIWLPKKALLSSAATEGTVFVVKDGLALRRTITVGERTEDKVRIVKGLGKGDLVVVEGQDLIRDLDEVKVEIIKGAGN